MHNYLYVDSGQDKKNNSVTKSLYYSQHRNALATTKSVSQKKESNVCYINFIYCEVYCKKNQQPSFYFIVFSLTVKFPNVNIVIDNLAIF